MGAPSHVATAPRARPRRDRTARGRPRRASREPIHDATPPHPADAPPTGRTSAPSHQAPEPKRQFGIGHLLSSSAEATRRLTATPLVPHGSRPLRTPASAAQNASPYPGVSRLRSGNISARPSARNSLNSLGISTLNSRQKQFSKWHCKASLGWYSLVKKQLGRLPKLTFRLS